MLPKTGVAIHSGANTAAKTNMKYQTRNAAVIGKAKPAVAGPQLDELRAGLLPDVGLGVGDAAGPLQWRTLVRGPLEVTGHRAASWSVPRRTGRPGAIGSPCGWRERRAAGQRRGNSCGPTCGERAVGLDERSAAVRRAVVRADEWRRRDQARQDAGWLMGRPFSIGLSPDQTAHCGPTHPGDPGEWSSRLRAHRFDPACQLGRG